MIHSSFHISQKNFFITSKAKIIQSESESELESEEDWEDSESEESEKENKSNRKIT